MEQWRIVQQWKIVQQWRIMQQWGIVQHWGIVKSWGIRTLILGVCCLGGLLLPTDSQAGEHLDYGQSGTWQAPTVSSLCNDSQYCVEWHDDTDGGSGPRTICCVEGDKLAANSYADCVVAFRFNGPRDEG